MEPHGKSSPPLRGILTLIELLVVLAILSLLTLMAAENYIAYAKDAKIAKVQGDLEILGNAIRLFMTREEEDYTYSNFLPLVGNYLNDRPPRDPWGNEYHIHPNQGFIYSFGADGLDNRGNPLSDDLVRYYIPSELILRGAEYIDFNANQTIDFDDQILLTFTRPITLASLTMADFTMEGANSSFGTTELAARLPGASPTAKISLIFRPPHLPRFQVGTTRMNVATNTDRIRDNSNPPKFAVRSRSVPLKLKRGG